MEVPKITKLEAQWEVIKSAEASKRAEYFKYCELAVEAVEAGKLSIEEGAYKICGISGQVLDVLSLDDRKIMDLACDLELPEAHRSGSHKDWQVLVRLVRDAQTSGPAS